MNETTARETEAEPPTAPRVVGQRVESAEEAELDAWFDKQALASVDNLEGAAKQLITLASSIITVLFGLMALTAESRPFFMAFSGARWLTGGAIVALFGTLAAALVVILPLRMVEKPHRPDEQKLAFRRLLRRKSWGVWVGAVLFGLGLLFVGGAGLVAILNP